VRTKPTARPRRRTGSADTINPDHINMHRLIVAGVIAALGAAVVTSWSGLTYIAGWQLLPPYLLWVTPVMIDVPLIVLTLARGALGKRGLRSPWLIVLIIGLTLYSSLANFSHSATLGGLASLAAIIGAATNALAPWLILMMTEVLWLVTTRQKRPTAKAKRPVAKRSPRAKQPPADLAPALLEVERSLGVA
jgi:hypothetical protein